MISIEALKTLLVNGFHKECVALTNDAIHQLTQRYAGRGGAFNINRVIPSVCSIFGHYLDALYWAYRSIIETQNENPQLKNLVSTCEFLGRYLQETGHYNSFTFDELHSPINTKKKENIYKVYMSCMWTDTSSLYKDWATLFDDVSVGNHNYLGHTSEGITFVLTEDRNNADYFVIIWGSHEYFTDEELSRTIFFRTEPIFPEKLMLGTEIKAEPLKFMKYFDYKDTRFPNCIENWLNRKSDVLLSETPDKPESLRYCLSSVVSNKYVDPGHRHRIDLLRHMVSCIGDENGDNILHIYGFDNSLGFPDKYYYGPLPSRDKSQLMKYRYTLIAENHSIPGYMTEKIADGILSECLVFYWGCPNIEDYFPPVDGVLPYVILPMSDVDTSYGIITTAMLQDWWSQRLPAIRATKKLILSKFMMKHRISQVIQEDINRNILGKDAINILNLSLSVDGNKKNIFTNIHYSGSRYKDISEMLSKRSNIGAYQFKGPSEDKLLISDSFVVQEFSNKPITDTRAQHYTVGYTRFSTCDTNHIKMLPKTFVVNLERRPDRLKQFDHRFPNKEVWKYTRFPAIDGAKLKVGNDFPKEIQHLFRNNDFCSKPSVIGCAMSHIKLWQSLVVDSANESYIIYEDDVEFTDNYTWKLFTLLQQVTFDWDILFLGHLMCYELQDTHRQESDELPEWESMLKYISPNRTSWVGTASYIISKRGAKKLLSYIEKIGVQHGIDYFLQLRFVDMLRAYGLNPMINFADYESPLNPKIAVDSDVQK